MKRLLPLLFLPLVLLGSPLSGGEAAGSRTLRMDLEGIGVIMARPPDSGGNGETSQLLLEKPGGMVKVLASVEDMEFTSLLKGDLDGDGHPEIVALAKNQGTEDLYPFIFRTRTGLTQVFPAAGEENPIAGREISIVSDAGGTALCVRVLEIIHDFGPPFLYHLERYHLVGDKLNLVGETLSEGNHYNLAMNRAGLAFQKDDFLAALKGYEQVLTQQAASMPEDAVADTLLAQAECRKFLKDFPASVDLYRRVIKAWPDSPQAESAGEEVRFLGPNLNNVPALSLFVDICLLLKREKAQEALQVLDAHPQVVGAPTVGDQFLYLRGEALAALDKVDEAIKVFRQLKTAYPSSALLEKVDTTIQELEGNPEETADR